MAAEFEKLNQFIQQFVIMTDAEFTTLNEQCNKVYFSKGDIIIKSGAINHYFYFINKGIVKYYIDNEDGYTRVYNFRTENMTLAGYGPYNHKGHFKALMNVKCIEDCEMIQLPMGLLHFVVKNYKFGERLGRYMAEAHVVELVNYIIDRDSKSILEKYEALEQSFPHIHQRIPQYLIASYLGITAVHLCNLKKTRKG